MVSLEWLSRTRGWSSGTRGVSASLTWIAGGAYRRVPPAFETVGLKDIELATDWVVFLQ